MVVFHALFFDDRGKIGYAVRQVGDILVELLKGLGFLKSSVGFAGQFPQHLYTQQIAISISGAILFGAYLLGSAAVTRVPMSVGHKKSERSLMERYRLSKVAAAILQRLILIVSSAFIILVFGFFVGSAVFGWFVVNIQSLLVLVFFSICFVFLPACAVVIIAWVVCEHLYRDLIYFVRRIFWIRRV
jgi:preprotein translocase subunit SecG